METLLPRALRSPRSPNVQLLLSSRVPARLAWIDRFGSPRVAPLWFSWTGAELQMSTFAGSRKLADFRDGDVVAVTIDTEAFPYRSLRIRGELSIEEHDGLTDQYRDAARRYLGDEPGAAWCQHLGEAKQVLLRVRPTEASESDMSSSRFMRPASPAEDQPGEAQ